MDTDIRKGVTSIFKIFDMEVNEDTNFIAAFSKLTRKFDKVSGYHILKLLFNFYDLNRDGQLQSSEIAEICKDYKSLLNKDQQSQVQDFDEKLFPNDSYSFEEFAEVYCDVCYYNIV